MNRRQIHDRPCAAKGLISYRYRGDYGWIMIGAKSHENALREANRSLTASTANLARLEVWDKEKQAYVPVLGD